MRTAALAGLALIASGVCSNWASAQEEVRVAVTMNASTAGPGAGTTITRRGLDKYAAALGLSTEQKEAAHALLEGYQASVADAQKAFAHDMAEIRRAFEETQDHTVFSERMPKARKEHRDLLLALERSLLADIRAILTPEQDERWNRVERIRRREVYLRGVLSGESVDLTEVVAGLNLGEPDAALREALEDYEADLDRVLKFKEALAAKGEPVFGGAVDVEEIRARAAEQREAGLKVKEVNERHARKIREMLPESARERFTRAVRRECFPTVYRPGRVARTIEAAERLDGVSAEQRQRLRALREQYDRESEPVNERLARAIEEAEHEGSDAGIVLGDGGIMRMSVGPQQPEGPLADARRARRELDDRFLRQVEQVLTPEQRERLPRQQDEFVPAAGAVRVIGGP